MPPLAPAGILWHSRQAEISGLRHQEVAVVFGDRVPLLRGTWTLGRYRNASGSLWEGTGRLLLDELAESLDVTISVSDELPRFPHRVLEQLGNRSIEACGGVDCWRDRP